MLPYRCFRETQMYSSDENDPHTKRAIRIICQTKPKLFQPMTGFMAKDLTTIGDTTDLGRALGIGGHPPKGRDSLTKIRLEATDRTSQTLHEIATITSRPFFKPLFHPGI
uniref:LPS-assembly protein lptD n=1 Tax=Lygus hesperus TaxID=30085 RepID=A0A0A9W7D3_LYGHE